MENSTLVGTKSTWLAPIYLFDWKATEPHFNADSLRVTKIGDDTEWTYVLSTKPEAGWINYVGKVVWIPPDSLIDITRPELQGYILDGKPKNEQGIADKQGKYNVVRAKNIRGVVSYGLLVKYSGNLNIGDDAASELGVIHYEPEEEVKQVNGDDDAAPAGVYYKYDVDSAMKYASRCFSPGENVFVTRKYNGENWKAVYKDGKFNVSSRTHWKKEFESAPQITVEGLIAKGVDPIKAEEIYKMKVVNFKPNRCKWWNGLSPEIENYLKDNEGNCIYGEIVNTQGGYSYGLKPGEIKVKIFDILKPDGTWLPTADLILACDRYGMDMVEVIHHYYPYNFENLRNMAETMEWTDCKKPNEGIVFCSLEEKWSYNIGRHKFKIVNSHYSQRN